MDDGDVVKSQEVDDGENEGGGGQYERIWVADGWGHKREWKHGW